MKFKDKNGTVFVPTSKFMQEKMKQSNCYTEVKKDIKPSQEQKDK